MAKLESKIRKVLEYIEEDIMQDNIPDNEPPLAHQFGRYAKRHSPNQSRKPNKSRTKED